MKPANTNAPYNLKGVRILVVEDFPFMAQLMSTMLKEFNVGKVLSTCSVQDAKKLIEAHNIENDIMEYIDLMITDLFPPRDEGLDLLRWVRSHAEETICYMPILFCTAHTTERVVTEGRDYGTNEIMVKPVSAEKLAARLLHIIDNPRPYIKAPHYFGPDRRRKNLPYNGAEKRQTQKNHLKEVFEQ